MMENFISIYAEQTPNPETLKFVANKDLAKGGTFDFTSKEEAERSPLAKALFEFEFVKGVFISANFVTITKPEEWKWIQIIPKMRTFLKEFIETGNEVVTAQMLQEIPSFSHDEGDSEIVRKIKDILGNNIRPVVEMDGGAIDFKSYDEGIVTLSLRGSCSGCPSSMVTLKGGIEGLLKRLLPEVKEVVAEAL